MIIFIIVLIAFLVSLFVGKADISIGLAVALTIMVIMDYVL